MTNQPTRTDYLGRPAEEWAGGLASPDALVRRLSAYALGEIGQSAEGVSAAALEPVLADSEPFVRAWAAWALARVRPSDPRAVATLVQTLQDDRPFVRSLAAWHLGRIAGQAAGIDSAIPPLDTLTRDPDSSVRAEAELARKAIDRNAGQSS